VTWLCYRLPMKPPEIKPDVGRMSERDIAKSIGSFIAFVASYLVYRACLYLGLDHAPAGLIGGAVFILGCVAAALWARRYPDHKPPKSPPYDG
jgi:hypothetical protein